MAIDLATAQANLNAANAAIKPYQDPNLLQNTQQAVKNAWTPLLTNSTQATQNMMADYLPRYMNIPYMGATAGTDANNLSAQQKLSAMGSELGNMSGRLTASGQLSDLLGGKASDMANAAVQNLQFGDQTAKDNYNRMFQEYQLADQANEAQKQRDFQARQAAIARAPSGSPAFNFPAPNFGQPGAGAAGGQPNAPANVLQAIQNKDAGALYQAMKSWESAYGGWDKAPQSQLSPYWAEWQGLNYGPWAKGMNQQDIAQTLASQQRANNALTGP